MNPDGELAGGAFVPLGGLLASMVEAVFRFMGAEAALKADACKVGGSELDFRR
jgi:hypothetical protein